MAVIAPKGVVGRVVGPGRRTRRACSSSSTAARAVGAVSERRGPEAWPSASTAILLGMELVSNLADVVAGGRHRRVGRRRHLPEGFTIGTVEKSERGPELHRMIAVRPAVDFSSLEEVLIVLCRRARGIMRRAHRGREVRMIGVLIALAGALALQTTLAGLTIGGATAVNLVLVAVIYVALAFGPRRASWPARPAVWCRTPGRGDRRRRRLLEDPGRVSRRPPRGAVHRGAVAAATRDVRQRHRRPRALLSGPLRARRARAFRMPWSAALTQAW